jgi:heterodisulfide reductase subunit B
MSPKSHGDEVVSAASAAPDWPWIDGLHADALGPDDINKLVPTVTEWTPAKDEEREKMEKMFLLAAAALKSRDVDLSSVKVSEEEAVKENKELRRKVKKLEKRSARDEDKDATMEVCHVCYTNKGRQTA